MSLEIIMVGVRTEFMLMTQSMIDGGLDYREWMRFKLLVAAVKREYGIEFTWRVPRVVEVMN